MRAVTLAILMLINPSQLLKSWELINLEKAIILTDDKILYSNLDRLTILSLNDSPVQKTLSWPSIDQIGAQSSMRIWASNSHYGLSIFDKQLNDIQHFQVGLSLPENRKDFILDAAGFVWALSLDGKQLFRYNTNPIQETYKVQLKLPILDVFPLKKGLSFRDTEGMKLLSFETLEIQKAEHLPYYNLSQKPKVQSAQNTHLIEKEILDVSAKRILAKKADSLYFYSR